MFQFWIQNHQNYAGIIMFLGSTQNVLYEVDIRLRACIYRGVLIMFLEYLQDRLHSRTRMQNVRSQVVRESVRLE